MKEKLLFILLIGCFLSKSSYSQQFEFIDRSEIRVIENGEALTDPFSGGFNAVHVSNVDIDNDGNTEWIVFDRSNNRAYVVNMINGTAIVDHDRSEFLPKEISNWMVMVDYDNDGWVDIFTDTSSGVQVIRNNEGTWEPLEGNLQAISSTSSVNIIVNGSDYPAIGDYDGDGDVDLLVFDFVAGDRIVLYKNNSVEDNLSDPLSFQKFDLFWGGLSECDCNDFTFNEEDCSGDGFGRPQITEHAAAKSITFSGEDLLVGIEGCPQLAVIPNRSNFSNPQFDNFQTDFFSKTDFGEYVITSLADVDQDGINDFIVSNNLRTDLYELDYGRSISVFSGSTNELITEQFLQTGNIEVGEQAYPTLYDWDQDGDLDLFVGNKGELHDGVYFGTIRYYENTGSFRDPEFTLRDEDFLNLSRFEYAKLSFSFINVDNDENIDIVLSAGSRNSLSANLFTLLGQGGNVFSEPIEWPLRFTRNDLPFVRDINSDGNLDVLLGRNFGRIEFHQNFGTNTNPILELQPDNFLGIEQDGNRLNPTLFFFNIDDDPEIEVLKSDASGVLEIYQNNNDTNEPTRTNYLNNINDEVGRFDFGINNPMSFGDLYGNNEIYGFIGDLRGGIQVIKLVSNTTTENDAEIIVFPNPVRDNRMFTLFSEVSQTVNIYDLSGKLVVSNIQLTSDEELTIDGNSLSAGTYLIRGTNNTFRLIIP